MKNRFLKLWSLIGAKSSTDAAFELLVNTYTQPHRFYHNLDHIRACLDIFEPIRSMASNPDSVEFALWYHDVVYDVRGSQNEEQSALIAYNTCMEAGLPDAMAREIQHLILTTKHTGQPQTRDQEWIADIDLAILGSPADEFNRYEANIRKEYAHVPEDQFRLGRTAILKAFLDKPAIYFTDYFIQKYQQPAAVNLQRSIARLRQISSN
ncbi:MAG: N-methyl-D-aspartate receptor NMDAR2C subunit [Anaerohalosphaeraceae bacterium]